ncbi:ankyrin-like protein [Thiorhodovibrio winogradskyi]|uniref:Ankyrin-like protein n=2 Tax=Thiorhodovibrio winogradskyi TaxID=77007 RepID=A0ABZ0S7B5_9GAMM
MAARRRCVPSLPGEAQAGSLALMKHKTFRLPKRVLLGCALAAVAGCGDNTTESGAELLQLAESGDTQALNALLGRRAEPNYRDACQWTPLMKAAVNGHLDAVRSLLDAGAVVDAADTGDYTALLLAASNNHARVVEALLARGAMIDHQENTQGFTALIWAAKRGHAQAVDALVRAGADKTLPDHEGRTAADWAAAEGHDRVLALLRED